MTTVNNDPPDPGGGERFENAMDASPIMSVSTDRSHGDGQSRPLKRVAENDVDVSISKKSIINHPSSAIQSTFTHPDFDVARSKYSDSDIAPFIINIQKNENDPASGVTLKPINFGHFLYKNDVPGVVKDGVKRIGRNRFAVEFNSAHHANNCLNHPALVKANFCAVIPSFYLTRMGIVRNISPEWTMEEVVNNMEVPTGFGRVIKARRLSRKTTNESNVVQWIPTQSVVVTFSGRTLPPHVYCFYNSLTVECYLFPTIQCNNCCRFGHIQAQCRSKSRCYKCGENHEGVKCNASVFSCLFCSGSHCANNQACPEHHRQRNIKLAMSQENLSYMEAAARYPSVRRSFAETSFSSSTQSQLIRPSPSWRQSAQPVTNAIPSQSHRKTIYVTRKSPAPASSPGYDRGTHNNIVRDPSSSQPNGCALNNHHANKDENIIELLFTLVTYLQKNDFEPNNMRQKIINFLTFYSQNASSDAAMELSQHS